MTKLHLQISLLEDEIRLLEKEVLEAMDSAVRTLLAGEPADTMAIIANDQVINAHAFRAMERVGLILATQTPTGRDVRQLLALRDVVMYLEQLGDRAKMIAKKTGRFKMPFRRAVRKRFTTLLEQMHETASNMTRLAVASVLTRDSAGAQEVIKSDDVLDALEADAHRAIAHMSEEMILRLAQSGKLAEEDKASAESLDKILDVWSRHHRDVRRLHRIVDLIEEVGDRAVHMANATIYLVTSHYPSERPPA